MDSITFFTACWFLPRLKLHCDLHIVLRLAYQPAFWEGNACYVWRNSRRKRVKLQKSLAPHLSVKKQSRDCISIKCPICILLLKVAEASLVNTRKICCLWNGQREAVAALAYCIIEEQAIKTLLIRTRMYCCK